MNVSAVSGSPGLGLTVDMSVLVTSSATALGITVCRGEENNRQITGTVETEWECLLIIKVDEDDLHYRPNYWEYCTWNIVSITNNHE